MTRLLLSKLVLVFLLLLLTGSPGLAQTPAEDLINAINKGDEKKAILLLKQGANPNARDELTQPAIAAAAYFGREQTVRALLESGADFRAVDNDGLNALHAAAAGGHTVIARLLLDRGLAINERGGTDGMTALANAAVRGHLPLMRLLLERHADVNLADSGGNTPLLHAAMRGRTEAVRLLLEHGARVNVASRHGWTPLMTAAWEGHTMIVKELLKHGADTKLMTTDGRSARMLAESEGHREIVRLLSDNVLRGAEPRPATAVPSAQQQVILSYFHDVLDGRQIGLLEKLFHTDCVIHRPEGTLRGLADIRGVVERNIVAYGEFETEVHDVIEAGDRVVVRLTHRATGAGVFRSRIGIHETKDKHVTWSAIVIFRLQNGKVAEQWVNRDELGMLLSLGVLKTGSEAR